MKFKAFFKGAWRGSWPFNAISDTAAWKTATAYVNEHTSVVSVDISEIWELDDSDNQIRNLPVFEDCVNIALEKKERKNSMRS